MGEPTALTLSREVLTVTNGSAVNLTVPDKADRALMQVRDAQVSVKTDGNAATTTVGMFFNAPSYFEIIGRGDLDVFSVIATTATNAAVEVIYYQTDW